MSDLKDWKLFSQFVQRFHTITDDFLDDVGVPRGQAAVLCTIVHDAGMSQSEIGERLAIQGATVTNMVQRMEESEFVRRQRDSEDNRLVRVFPTDLGRVKEEMIADRLEDVQERILTGFTDADKAKLRELLGRIVENMERP